MASGTRSFAVVFAAAALCGAVSSEVMAQEWLTGASVGQSKTYDYSVGGPVATSDDSAASFRAFGGYTFIPFFGLVGSLVDLGETKYDGPAFGGFTDTLSVQGVDVSAMGILPVNKHLGLFGTVGGFYWKQKVRYTDSTGYFPYDDKGVSLSLGVGANIDLFPTHTWGIHIEWERFMDVGDDNNSGHQYDRDFYSTGFVYRFGAP